MNDDNSNQEQEGDYLDEGDHGDYSEDMDMDNDVEMMSEQEEEGDEEPKEKMVLLKIDASQAPEEIKKFWREWETIKMPIFQTAPS